MRSNRASADVRLSLIFSGPVDPTFRVLPPPSFPSALGTSGTWPVRQHRSLLVLADHGPGSPRSSRRLQRHGKTMGVSGAHGVLATPGSGCFSHDLKLLPGETSQEGGGGGEPGAGLQVPAVLSLSPAVPGDCRPDLPPE